LPGAELALKLIGSAYLIYLAFRIASSRGITRTVVSRPLGVLHAAAFQFANPKGWLFAFAAVGTFLPRDLAPMPGALAVAATSAAIILATATVWAAGGAALSRTVDGGRMQRAVNLALALLLAASVAFIWV
jgi:threonine/homoserine/homoserine lactone efflux protein